MQTAENKRDNYHIVSLIGQGAYGQVYKARRKQTGQFVAIKTIKKKGKQEKDIVSMRQEIEILKKLKHENIILLLDSFETSSEFVIITELGQGELFNIIEDDQCLPEPEIRKIAQQLVKALHYLHSNRITHRDMKPQNILISSNGVVKLCDFGFARHMSYNTQVLTSIKGTPLYMAPEMVKELPYTHTADLWSLGVILYQLATGGPPFTASNLFGLVQHIVNDPIKYPDTLGGEFKAFLKGLLNKNPSERLGWPDLLNHPFIRETEQEKNERKRRMEKYNQWLNGDSSSLTNKDDSIANNGSSPQLVHTGSYRSTSNVGFDDKRDLSPRKTVCIDDIWNKYESQALEEKGATMLRADPIFLDKLLSLLSTNINEILRVKDKKGTIQCALKVLTLIIVKGKTSETQRMDVIRNSNIPGYILTLLKNILKIQGGKNHIEFISDIVRTIGLLAKSTFDKNVGIETAYIRSFVPLLPFISKAALMGEELPYQNLVTNLVKTIGIFANNASANHIRSFSFYKELVEVKFMQDAVAFLRQFESQASITRFIIQVFCVLMHPLYGDISTFPWKRSSSTTVSEFNECATMFDCLRQTIMNCLNEIDWVSLFSRLFQLEDDSNNIVKISILRILLQSARQSKEFAERIVSEKQLMKVIVFGGLSLNEPFIYSTACLLIAHLLKYVKEKKKEKIVETLLNNSIPTIIDGALDRTSPQTGLIAVCSFAVLQEVINSDAWNYQAILARFEQLSGLRCIADQLSNPQVNKIEEMRKLEGSNYGCHMAGYYDSAISFLHRFVVKHFSFNAKQKLQLFQIQIRYIRQHPKSNDIYKILEEVKIDDRIIQMFASLSAKTDLSPRGFITLLMFTHDFIAESKSFANRFFITEDACLKCLISLLRETQLQSLHEWPANHFGGGTTCLQLLSANLNKIFILALQQPSDKDLDKLTRLFFNNEVVKVILNYTKYLNRETINSPLTFLCRLVLYDEKDKGFIKQFIEEDGLSIYSKFHLLAPDSSTAVVLQGLSLLSQLARFSKDYYQNIAQMNIFPDLKRLIGHSDPAMRSRVLNLIGNLCRHTNYFYRTLLEYDLIRECIRLCEDSDKASKKFACVAVGNAGFHDDSLYDQLRPAIPILVELLKDPEEKTRANAAAALGNFVRNSAALDHDFNRTGAVYQLVSVVTNDKLLGPKKIALMSINNLMSLPECSKILMGMDIGKIVAHFLGAGYSSDPGIAKTAAKILDKLNTYQGN